MNNLLLNIADEFEVSMEVLCMETGRSRLEMQRILGADSIIYPGGVRKQVMDQLLMLSHEIRDKEIARTLAEDQRRRKYLRTIGQKYGIHLGQNEDPFEF